jgi:predicted nucleotidyltransferase component of viral defense system
VGVLFPWQRGVNCRVKLEISHHEPVLDTPEAKPLIHNYSQPLAVSINCYTLNEVVAEKMRALLQSHQKLVQNSWHRPRARDYYDLWQILKHFGDHLDSKNLLALLRQKTHYVEVSFSTIDDFFTPELLQEAQEAWQSNLGPFVLELPPCNVVLQELRAFLPRYFPALK